MSTYELDDDQVRQLLRTAQDVPRALANALEKQLPIPVPTGIGAVVRTGEGVLVRVSPDNDSQCEWWLMGEFETIEEQARQWTATSALGRITEVLSEGVDL